MEITLHNATNPYPLLQKYINQGIGGIILNPKRDIVPGFYFLTQTQYTAYLEKHAELLFDSIDKILDKYTTKIDEVPLKILQQRIDELHLYVILGKIKESVKDFKDGVIYNLTKQFIRSPPNIFVEPTFGLIRPINNKFTNGELSLQEKSDLIYEAKIEIIRSLINKQQIQFDLRETTQPPIAPTITPTISSKSSWSFIPKSTPLVIANGYYLLPIESHKLQLNLAFERCRDSSNRFHLLNFFESPLYIPKNFGYKHILYFLRIKDEIKPSFGTLTIESGTKAIGDVVDKFTSNQTITIMYIQKMLDDIHLYIDICNLMYTEFYAYKSPRYQSNFLYENIYLYDKALTETPYFVLSQQEKDILDEQLYFALLKPYADLITEKIKEKLKEKLKGGKLQNKIKSKRKNTKHIKRKNFRKSMRNTNQTRRRLI